MISTSSHAFVHDLGPVAFDCKGPIVIALRLQRSQISTRIIRNFLFICMLKVDELKQAIVRPGGRKTQASDDVLFPMLANAQSIIEW